MTKEIKLTKGKVALVSDHRYEYLSQWKWCAVFFGKWYAYRVEKGKTIFMHRVIAGITEKGVHTDHIDGDGLNNQDENLRRATNSQNQHNSKLRKDNVTGYKGVSRSKYGTYKAALKVNQKVVYRATFSTAIDAAHAYDNAARKYCGPYALLNFPDEHCDPVPNKYKGPRAPSRLKQVALALIEYRDRVGPLNFQLEKADDFINMMRALLRHP